MADRAGDGHCNQHQRDRNDFGHVVEVDVLQAGNHQDTDIDQRRRGCSSGDDRCDRSDEDAGEEQQAAGQSSQAGASARFNTRSGFDEGGNSRGTGQRTDSGTNRVREQDFLHLRNVAVLIQHAGTACGTDDGADGVEHVDHAEGDDQGDDGEPANLCKARKVELEQGSGSHIAKCRDKGCSLKGSEGIVAEDESVACPVDDAGSQHAKDNRAFDVFVCEDDNDKQADKHCDDRQHHLRVSSAHVVVCQASGQRTEEVAHDIEAVALIVINADVGAEADVQKHQADCRSNAQPDTERDCVDNLVTDIEDGQDHKDNALDEDNAEGCLEGFQVGQSCQANDVGNNNCKEAVQPHARCKAEGLVRQEGHRKHCNRRSDAGCEKDAVPEGASNVKVGQKVGVECDDVSHCHEGGHAGYDLSPHRGTIFLQFEELFQR